MQPWFVSNPEPSLSCCLSYLTCLFPITKALRRVRRPPPDKGFCSSKENKQQFSKHTEVCFCQRLDFSIVKIKYALPARFKSSGAEEAPVQVEQVFPNTQYLLDHSRSRNVKTSSSCGHVQSRPTCSSHGESGALRHPCALLAQEKQKQHGFKRHLQPDAPASAASWVPPANIGVIKAKMTSRRN